MADDLLVRQAMRAVVQRVESASVSSIDDTGGSTMTGSIGPGLCVLIGVTHDDDPPTAHRMAEKLYSLRIFDDADGVMNLSSADRAEAGEVAEILVVSQFTLYGDTTRGRRPSWVAAARPEHAEPLIDIVVEHLIELGAVVATGRFRTQMKVELVNDGPVTVVIDL